MLNTSLISEAYAQSQLTTNFECLNAKQSAERKLFLRVRERINCCMHRDIMEPARIALEKIPHVIVTNEITKDLVRLNFEK